jgi:hypothetical protein
MSEAHAALKDQGVADVTMPHSTGKQQWEV